jgi:hypothetical protein
MIPKLANAFVILSALAAIAFAPAAALAGKIKDAGRIDATYVKRDAQPIPDREGHVLLLTESSGPSLNPGGLVDGFSATIREIADLRQGTGMHQGYVIYSKGADQQVVRFEGMVTTTMKDGKPSTTVKGTYSIVGGSGALAGIEGKGSYSGYFTAEDKFHIDWEGSRSAQKDAMASSGKN